jgi:hypothetical protein
MACTEESLFPKEQVPASPPTPPPNEVGTIFAPAMTFPAIGVLPAMSTRPRSPPGDPMTLGNMRANGVRSLVVRDRPPQRGLVAGTEKRDLRPVRLTSYALRFFRGAPSDTLSLDAC